MSKLNQTLPIPIYITVTSENNKPMLILKKKLFEPDLFKVVISCAHHHQPVSLLPMFKNPIRSLSSLLDKGILYKKGNNYYFTY